LFIEWFSLNDEMLK